MAADEDWGETNANEMLLKATENLFYNETQHVIQLLKSNRELFSREVLDQSLLSCCRNNRLLLMPAIISTGANVEVTEENGNTPLLVCALYGYEYCAKCLIGAGANVNAVNFDGNTPLIVSVSKSAYIGMTKLLVGYKNIQIDHANKNGYTALLSAVETANLIAIKLLIDAGASSEIKVSHETILNFEEFASRKGLLHLINLFKLQKSTGKSSLLQAALERDIESAQIITNIDDSIVNTSNESFASIIIQFLKSIEESNNVVNETDLEMFEFLLAHLSENFQNLSEKKMIMDIAISIANHTIVESLLKDNFVISYKNLRSVVSKPDFLRFLLTKRHIINKLDGDNQPVYVGSPLRKAMREVELESAKALIQHGAFMDIDLAMEDAVKSNKEKSLQFLISEFPDEVGQKLQSPKLLHDAVINSALNVISVLLDHGADINAEYNGYYCLTQAVDVNVLELLLSRGADPNVKIGSYFVHTYPLHTFLSKRFQHMLRNKQRLMPALELSDSLLKEEIKDFVQCLLRYGAYIDLKDCESRTALLIAVDMSYSIGILKLLVDSGADVNIMDGDGKTPLLNAVINENVEIVKFLLEAGADVDFVCEFMGKSVIFHSTNETILQILLDNGANVKPIDGDSPLNSLLAQHHIGTENVKRLIDAGCDVNHQNTDGYTALILAAKYVDIQLLELLVQEGADVNASGSQFPYLTAVTAMLSKLWKKPERATSCIHYLIDHNAHIDKVHPGVIHCFISSGCYSLIPRFISRGLAPTHLLVEKPFNSWFPSEMRVSPLMMALFLDQSDLARYFIDIKYITKSDIYILVGNTDVHKSFEELSVIKSLDLLKTVWTNPLSLETLCLVVLSEILGSTQDRRSKVEKLELSRPLQDLLLFKSIPKADIIDVGERSHSVFKMSLKQINL